jgi:ParB-like chromosome segregation protein Spo0J
MMHTLAVDTQSIFIGERHRALSDEAVTRLQDSMRALGLKQPISIRIVEEMEVDGTLTAGVPVLVTGAHRLEAAKRLNWTHIDCFEVDDDAIKAELWEIAENLHRCELTKEQRDAHIRRYAELLDAQARIAPQAAEQKRGRPISTATKVARATGLSDDTVRRALKPTPKPIPVPNDPVDVTEQQFRSLMSAWNRAGKEARDLFMEEIGALA